MSRARRKWISGAIVGAVLAVTGVSAAAADPGGSTEQIVRRAQAHAPKHQVQQATGLQVKVDAKSKAGVITLVPGADVQVTPADVANSVTQAQPDGLQVLTVIRKGNKAVYKLNIPRGLELRQANGGYDLIADGPVGPVVVLSVDAPWAVDANGKQLPTAYSLQSGRLIQTVETEGAAYPITADPYFARKWYGAQIQFTWNETRFMAAGAGAVAVVAAGLPDATITKIVMVGAGAVAWWASTAAMYNRCIALNVWWSGTLVPWYWSCPH